MTKLGWWIETILVVSLLLAFAIGFLIQSVTLTILAGFPLVMWMTFHWIAGMEREYDAWDRYYTNMPIDRKIEHHLDRARRLGSNVDANLAQALIERQRQGRV